MLLESVSDPSLLSLWVLSGASSPLLWLYSRYLDTLRSVSAREAFQVSADPHRAHKYHLSPLAVCLSLWASFLRLNGTSQLSCYPGQALRGPIPGSTYCLTQIACCTHPISSRLNNPFSLTTSLSETLPPSSFPWLLSLGHSSQCRIHIIYHGLSFTNPGRTCHPFQSLLKFKAKTCPFH